MALSCLRLCPRRLKTEDPEGSWAPACGSALFLYGFLLGQRPAAQMGCCFTAYADQNVPSTIDQYVSRGRGDYRGLNTQAIPSGSLVKHTMM